MHPFRRAVEARDHAAIVETFAPDIVVHSPVLFRPLEGRETASALSEVRLTVFGDFRYTDELRGDDGTTALVFQARIGAREVEGLDLLRHDAEGRVDDFTVTIRPLTGLQALSDVMGARIGDLLS